MEHLNKKYIALLSADDRNKSEAIWNIVRLIRLDVNTDDDLTDFSDDLKQAVKMILDRNRR